MASTKNAVQNVEPKEGLGETNPSSSSTSVVAVQGSPSSTSTSHEEEQNGEAPVLKHLKPVSHVNVYTQAGGLSAADIVRKNLQKAKVEDEEGEEGGGGENENSTPDSRASQEPYGRKWYAVRKSRVQVWRNTKQCFRNTKIVDWEDAAYANVARWSQERVKEPIAKRCVEVVTGDWGTVLHDLTVRYGEWFVLSARVDPEQPGGQFWTGAANMEADLMRRTNASFFIPRGPDAEYEVEDWEQLLGCKDTLPLHTTNTHILIRGPEELPDFDTTWSSNISHVGYRHFKKTEIVPFFYMPFAVEDTRDRQLRKGELATEVDALAETMLRTVAKGNGRFLLLQDFGPGISPYMGAKAFSKAIDKFPDAFDKVVFCVHPRCEKAYRETLEGKVHRGAIYLRSLAVVRPSDQ